MTLNEAIEVLINYTYGNEPVVSEKGRQAILLCIGASEQWSLYRSGYVPSQAPLLPGETKE